MWKIIESDGNTIAKQNISFLINIILIISASLNEWILVQLCILPLK